MKFLAYGYNLTKEDTTTITNMFKLITTETPEIRDLKSYELEVESDTILFLYGEKAVRQGDQARCLVKMEFPDATRLSPSFGDPELRKDAFTRLCRLKDELASGVEGIEIEQIVESVRETIQVSSLPNLSSAQVAALETVLKSKGISAWICKDTEGRKIRISMEPEHTDADINLTFRELYALKVCAETLHIQEFNIAYRPNHTSKDSSH